jgi:hypothetical protein
MGEDCHCVDCAGTAYCNPGQCTNTGTLCDHLLDSCTCPNCAEDGYCGDPDLGNCNTDGGACDPFKEGCHCPNCWTYSACTASVAACSGGKPDGVCDRGKETCACVDCQGTPLCEMCQNAGVCGDNEACSCADCIHAARCNDPMFCTGGGACAIVNEGCICPACASLPECTQWLDAGTDALADAGDGGTDAPAD